MGWVSMREDQVQRRDQSGAVEIHESPTQSSGNSSTQWTKRRVRRPQYKLLDGYELREALWQMGVTSKKPRKRRRQR